MDIKIIAKYMLTEIDNTTWDYSKIVALVFSILLIAISIYEVFYLKTAVTFNDVCGGFDLYLTSVGAILRLKKDTPIYTGDTNA